MNDKIKEILVILEDVKNLKQCIMDGHLFTAGFVMCNMEGSLQNLNKLLTQDEKEKKDVIKHGNYIFPQENTQGQAYTCFKSHDKICAEYQEIINIHIEKIQQFQHNEKIANERIKELQGTIENQVKIINENETQKIKQNEKINELNIIISNKIKLVNDQYSRIKELDHRIRISGSSYGL